LKFVVYDIETIRTFFCACFKDYETGTKKEFKLHYQDQASFDDYAELLSLIKFLNQLKKHKYFLVGLNNIRFDFQVIEFILNNYEDWINFEISIEEIILKIYNESQRIIGLSDQEVFENLIPEHKFSIPNIDVFKQKHYDGKAKRGTSLKWLQFTTRYWNVEEMPIGHDAVVNKTDIKNVIEYCWNDVDSTFDFFKLIKFETDLRMEMCDKYSLPLLNSSEPALARLIFGHFLSKEMKITYKQLKELKTFRKEIKFKNIILPYFNFKTSELQNIFTLFQNFILDASPQSGQKFAHNFKYKGIEIDLGLGGIHGCIRPGIYEAKEGTCILDVDVKSFYPNLGIENDLKPYHLGKSFTKVYKDLYDQRKIIPKKDPTNYVYKIILNSVYGLSNEINGYLYDPLYTYSITINGQLSLLMLAEMLYSAIPDLQVYQYNTDGVTIGFEDEFKDTVYNVCKQWEEITKLELEYADYQKMVIADVNSYIGVYKDEKLGIKRVGRFEYEMKPKGKIDYHNNPSFLIIPKAIEQYFVYGKDYKDFITNHEDIYDFLGAVKKKSDFDLNIHKLKIGCTGEEAYQNFLKTGKTIEEYLQERGWSEWYGKSWKKTNFSDMGAVDIETAFRSELSKDESTFIDKIPQQKVTRYFVSKMCETAGMLIKDYKDGKMKGRQVAVMSDYPVQILNKVTDTNAKNYNIDYSWYINEVKKEIFGVEGNKQQLTLF
jgi:hypothetical protein